MTKYDTVYYWAGDREAGEWMECVLLTVADQYQRALDVAVGALEKAGRVTVRGLRRIGPPEGPPSDQRFKALGL